MSCSAIDDGALLEGTALLQFQSIHSASIVTTQNKDTLMIVGGISVDRYSQLTLNNFGQSIIPDYSNEETISKSQFVSMSEKATLGPYMPMSLSHQCFIKINETLAMMAGGYTDKGKMTDSTFFYQITSEEWSLGPSLILSRARHPCGILKLNDNNKDKEIEVAVIAGGDTTSDDVSTELLMLNTLFNDTWQAGPPLPRKLESPAMVSTKDRQGLLLIGGTLMSGERSNLLLKLQCPTIIEACVWQELPQKLSNPRFKALFIRFQIDVF